MTTTDNTTLPDDPRECCREICRQAIEVLDASTCHAPGDLASLVRVIIDAPDGPERVGSALGTLADLAEAVALEQVATLQRISDLARHGTGDHREEDARAAAGRSPFPPSPTVAEVKGAQAALAALGRDASKKAALAILGEGAQA